MRLTLKTGSYVAALYGSTIASEQYNCNFGVNPAHVSALAAGPLAIVGADAEGEVRVVEWPGHPFFIGTLFVPQLSSASSKPHPLINGFLTAAGRRG
jgi:CTP synthase (UTP-ammonia lyase)